MFPTPYSNEMVKGGKKTIDRGKGVKKKKNLWNVHATPMYLAITVLQQ